MAKFTVVLTPEPKAGGFSVSVPALPGCFSQGDTLESALENIREAIGLHMWGIEHDGDPIPPDVTPIVTTVDAELIEGEPIDEKELAAINDAPPWDGRTW
jgi:predicted RNase H-like HicB family nuclease